MDIIIQPFSEQTMGQFLLEVLDNQHGEFTSFQAAVAYAKRSGVQYLKEKIKSFTDDGKTARIIVGIDQQGTSIEGLESLLEALGTQELYINHDENSFVTFHPKIYYFDNDEKGLLIVGSGNLTQGGLYSNDEGFAIIELDKLLESDRNKVNQLLEVFNRWCDDSFGTVRLVDSEFIQLLSESGYIVNEVSGFMRPEEEPVDEDTDDQTEATHTRATRTLLFGRGAVRRRPPRSRSTRSTIRRQRNSEAIANDTLFGQETENEPTNGFVMTLMKTDVGTGQTTPGTSRRSPEIFIPLAARDADPEFWGWIYDFTEDHSKPGKYDRNGVKMRIGGEVINVNMMTWPVKHDFRLRSEALRSAGNIGDLIRIEKTESSPYFDYYVEIIPKDTNNYDYYNNFCTNAVRNSQRKWGYY